jgi:5-methylcytosine-specific restriction endonuclease McrA
MRGCHCVSCEGERTASRNRMREMLAADPGYATRQSARWRADNPERLRELKRESYRRHPETVSAKGRQRRTLGGDAHRLYMKIHWHHFRTRRAGNAATDLTVEQLLELMAAYSGKCAYCGRESLGNIDHVVPISLGGGNAASNVVPCCRSCNSKKGGNVWNPRDPANVGNSRSLLEP